VRRQEELRLAAETDHRLFVAQLAVANQKHTGRNQHGFPQILHIGYVHGIIGWHTFTSAVGL